MASVNTTCLVGICFATTLAASTAIGDLIIPVDQYRYLEGYAYAEDLNESDDDFKTAESDNFDPFVASASASAQTDYAYASGGGWHNSQITGMSIQASGSSFANAEAYDFDAYGDGSGYNACEFTFDVIDPATFSLQVYLAAYDNGYVEATFTGPNGDVVYIDSPWNDEFTQTFEGTLDAGQYTVKLNTSSGAYADYGFPYDYGFGEFGLTLDLEAEAPCPEDVNSDTEVNIDDVFAVLAAWGACDNCPEDVNADGYVDIDDVFAVLAAWGPCS